MRAVRVGLAGQVAMSAGMKAFADGSPRLRSRKAGGAGRGARLPRHDEGMPCNHC
jgi:hypothetical protein